MMPSAEQLYATLPSPLWERAPEEYRPAPYRTSLPPIQKLADGRLAIDASQRPDGGYDIRAFDNIDHPLLACLPPNAPRAVRQILRREWRLRYVRATDWSAFGPDLERAADAITAWEERQLA